jgi:hypothetical protein
VSPSPRALGLYAVIGLIVWLIGAVMFRFGGHLMFESGTTVFLLCVIGVAVSVCVLLRATMNWRKALPSDAVTIAVAMALPGLFGDVGYILAFPSLTGLPAATAGPFAALFAYALIRAGRAPVA